MSGAFAALEDRIVAAFERGELSPDLSADIFHVLAQQKYHIGLMLDELGEILSWHRIEKVPLRELELEHIEKLIAKVGKWAEGDEQVSNQVA